MQLGAQQWPLLLMAQFIPSLMVTRMPLLRVLLNLQLDQIQPGLYPNIELRVNLCMGIDLDVLLDLVMDLERILRGALLGQ
jgi:hypothetical protein